MKWITCTKNHFNSVCSFLENEEPCSVSCITRIMREKTCNSFPASAICMALVDETVAYEHTDTLGEETNLINGLVYYSSAHMLYPVFPNDTINKLSDTDDQSFIKILNDSAGFEGIIGRSRDVHALEAYIPTARVTQMYDFMIEENSASLGASASLQTDLELRVRKATNDDLQELVAIEAAYQKEEVLTPIHEFNLAVCKANQQYALFHVPVYVALYKNKIIARAQINGSGKSYEQIGGIYVKPEFRRLHAGTAVMAALMSDIRKRGKIPCLYVKQTNIPAKQLYQKLGFTTIDEFSILYH